MSRQIDLFLPTNQPNANALIAVIDQWARKRKQHVFTVKPVLENAVEVVKLQLFYTPALVIDGKIISMQIDSAETLHSLLASLL